MGQPDTDGNIFSRSAQAGNATLASLSDVHGEMTAIVSAGTFNVRTATCGGGCRTCVGLTSVAVSGSSGVAVGNTTQFTATAYYSNGSVSNVTAGSLWTTTNSSIAGVDSAGIVSGVAVGSVWITANYDGILGGVCPLPPTDDGGCPTVNFAGSQSVTATPPTATVTVRFAGSKTVGTPGDGLTFPSNRTCSQNLGLFNCPGPGTWVWNVELQGSVSDDASKWRVTQSYAGRKKGYYKNSSGQLVSFDNTLSVTDDSPTAPAFLQQVSGQKTIFWIDAPGHGYKYDNGQPVDSVTQVQNFTSTACRTTSSGDCSTVTWYFKLVVNPGAALDSTNSSANLGSASTNF